jgi:hypothetical protein
MLKKFFENVNRQIKAPLTFVLSRRGREEKEEKILRKPLTLTLSRKVERVEKEGKDFKSPLTLALSRRVEREKR